MPAKEFNIPDDLTRLITSGFWPNDDKAANKQNLSPLLSKSAIQKFAGDEQTIFFYPTPFVDVKSCLKNGGKFWSDQRSASSEIDPAHTLLIGDFGLGSDAPIALDYRKSETEPAVIRLHWADEGNHWIEVAPNFETFAKYITG